MTQPNVIGLSKPPEGVLVGESVPPENESAAIDQAKVERVTSILKTDPRYAGRTEAEREEAARRLIERTTE